ncbi:hypothetical protein HYDPIDRAFT_100725 [Hydnomerulius pinastri MD-312]|uniref:SH3 domain-containing protein n=1 Tax=Hydnomerulius pinastri MD-312 TaxID=994086 RepID=A0A0C9V2F5_9AGAM|nr:hypothetical protein HYDPIDRAFT_100725 [Hydnomerulius pinastri MD-312]
MQSQEQPKRTSPKRQDTFDLRDQIMADDHSMASSHMHAHADATNVYGSSGGASDEEHSVLEDDSDGEDREMDYIDDEDDRSSSLSIPNESIDFDLVYSLHSFAATVEGQASVVKGDSLFLMDDTNSYWWLVRVLKTQDVGYIPAENIETPFERLARLNKHRNVDLAHATPQELQEDVERVRNNLSSRTGSHHSPSPTPGVPAGTTPRPGARGVMFTPALSVHRYPPAVWNEEEEEDEDVEWDDGAYEEEDPELAEEMSIRQRQSQVQDDQEGMSIGAMHMEPDDGMSWDDSVAEDMQARNAQKKREQQMLTTPDTLRPGSAAAAEKQMQQQQEIIIAQQRQQQQEQQMLAQQQAQGLRHQTSRDRLAADKGRPVSPSSPSKTVDPAEATETKKLTVTPSIARDEQSRQAQTGAGGPLLPSAIMQKQEDERKRTREEIEVLEEAAKRKKGGKDKPSPTNPTAPVTNQPAKAAQSGGGKLRKEQRDTTDDEGKEKREKKNRGVFGLFGRKKDKNKDKVSIESTSSDTVRESQESGRSSSLQHGSSGPEQPLSPVTATAMQQQQQSLRTSLEKQSPARQQQPQGATPQTPPHQVQGQVSQHASQLRQRDQQQQALYQQYLNRSPSSPPEAPSYGLQSASAVLGTSPYTTTPSSTAAGLGLGLSSSRPRPGSLVLSPTADGQGVGVPELSVIRVFAGKHVQTEATFKTVLLNSSTTSSDLVRQAIQRFRLPTSESEDASAYYLTVKQVEGSSAVLLPEEKPLGVFETLVEAAMELPKVKRSSVGSISSVSSNLSMHPAIKKLSMNDFSDDSAVKFYLNKRGGDGRDSASTEEDEGDDTLYAETSRDTIEGISTSSSSGVNVTPDRFSSPSFRFALQLVIFPEDLPDDMVFDPLTEAIVFKNTLRDRTTSTSSISSGVSQSQRRKVFTFPKNVTVAEVIELGLERFGILEGVVDGGDEVEDKLTKRRSSTKVRYWLTASIGGQERELSPSSRVVDAYARPPTFRRVQEGKRRSIDSTLLLGNLEDVGPDDPSFILRRAISYRTSSSRHRMSAPLDEIALQHLRDSVSGSSLSSDQPTSPSDDHAHKPRQLSRQEIIAAQRAASREKQRAILSAQTNSVRGVDVLLPGNAMIRSSRYDSGDKIRYSYVQDGESFDVSDIIEQELRETSGTHKNDLLEGVFGRNKDGMNEKIDRVLTKIKDGRLHSQFALVHPTSSDQSDSLHSARSTSSSEYSVDDLASARSDGRTPTPLAGAFTGAKRTASPVSDHGSRTPTPTAGLQHTRARSNTPPSKAGPNPSHTHRQPSIASVMSDISTYATPTAQLVSPVGSPLNDSVPKPQTKRPYIPRDDFGVSQMMAIIEIAGTVTRPQEPPLHPVEEVLFGKSVEVQSLHPDIREIYSGAFQQLDEMDKVSPRSKWRWDVLADVLCYRL